MYFLCLEADFMKLVRPVLFLAAFLLVSCGKKDSAPRVSADSKIEETPSLQTWELSGGVYASAPDAFKLDFTPQVPEEPSVPKKLGRNFAASRGRKVQKEVPARKLSDYAVQYRTKRVSYADMEPAASAGNRNAPDSGSSGREPLAVVDWGPQQEIVHGMEYPTFYVVFSQPVRALSALEEPSDSSDVMKITPPVKGVFRWYGTNSLAFECSEGAEPGQQYTMEISRNLTSVSGVRISGETRFVTAAPDMKILSVVPGTEETRHLFSARRGVPPEYASDFFIRLNAKLTVQEFSSAAEVLYDGKTHPFTARLHFEKGRNYPSDQVSDCFFVHIDGSVGKNTTVLVRLKRQKSAPDFSGCDSASYVSLKPFSIEQCDTRLRNSFAKQNFLNITFSQAVDAAAVAGNISIAPEIHVSPEQIEVRDNVVSLKNLAMRDFGKTFRIRFGAGIRDVYGQQLSDSSFEREFSVPNAACYFRLCDTGNKIMEYQFPHRVAIDYQNIRDGSFYSVRKASDPLSGYSVNPAALNPKTLIGTVPENTRNIDMVELDPYLDDGYGFVTVESQYIYDYFDSWQNTYSQETGSTRLNVQVTDLGVTARIGINKAVVMVRSLSSGMPVENASVALYRNAPYEEEAGAVQGTPVCSGSTDKNGIAVIDISESEAQMLERLDTEIAVIVRKGKDAVTFVPDTHSLWSSGISEARRVRSRVFLFTDRSLYKPGEKVTFRGIDKNQHMGAFSSYSGNYTVTLTSSYWNDEEVYGTLTGTAGSSGGFWGAFELPQDIKPGRYRISYFREGNESRKYGYNGSVYITVSYFENAKIQAEVTVPDMTYIGGDSVNAKIAASYLAGGALSNAQYETVWYRSPVRFSPDSAEAKGYVFGPENFYDSLRTAGRSSGQLESDGTASVSCRTEKTASGAPYSYRIETSVTDISNQKLTAAASVTVHPAKAYIGIKAPHLRGFAEKNRKIDFSYILLNTDGTEADSSLVSGGIDCSVQHVTWEMNTVNGVADELYTRYYKKETEVHRSLLNLSGEKSFSFTPEKPGEYTVCLKAKDSAGNSMLTQFSFYATGSGSVWFRSESENKIDLTADRSLYNPGDTAKVLLKSQLPSGDYMITVEREGIYSHEVRHFDTPVSVIEIPVARNYVPVVYVCVSSYSVRTKAPVHEYGEKDMDKPKGFFGYTKLHVNPQVKSFSVEILPDKTVYRPGETAVITLKATKGGVPVADAELTVMAVDRAVIDLIDYHVPNPIEFFYDESSFANCVMGGDSRDFLMDPVTYKIKSLAGGDSMETKEDERRDFRPTALFEPAVKTDKNGIASCSFVVPSQLTTFRMTAFGVKGEQFALQEDEIGVRNPVNVQAVQPRRLRVRDTAECGVLVTNLENKAHTVSVSVDVRAPSGTYDEDEEKGLLTVAGSAFVDGADEKTVTVAAGASETVYFDVAAEKSGTVELAYSIKSAVLNETLISPVLIEKSYVFDTVLLTGETDSKKREASRGEQLLVPSWAEDGQGSLSVTLDATRLGLLSSAVHYVFDYPFGCIEQRTSAMLPLVAFEEYISVFDLQSKVSSPRKAVRSYFSFLKNVQKENGGFGCWKDSREVSLYVSCRVAQLYAMARQRGYSESDLAIDAEKLASFIEKKVAASTVSDQERIFALCVLQSMGRTVSQQEISRLYSDAKGKSLDVMALCGICWISENSPSSVRNAEKAAAEIRKYLQVSQRGISVVQLSCSDETMACILKLFSLCSPEDGMVDRIMYTLLQRQSHGYWTNTRATACVLDAVHSYIKGRNLDEADFSASVLLGGTEILASRFKGAGAQPAEKTVALKEIADGNSAVSLQFEKSGKGTLYYSALMKYALPDELQNARDEGISVSCRIYDTQTDAEVMPSSKDSKLVELESGKTYKAVVVVSTAKNREFIAVRAPVPSGAEIIDANFATVSTADKKLASDKSEVSWKRRVTGSVLYDNEAQFFWDSFERGNSTVQFVFRTSRRGVYPVPPVQAECMYEPEVFGRSDGYLFVIK